MKELREDLTIEEVTSKLDELIIEKSEALNTVNIAVNEYVSLKNKYTVKSNELKLKLDEIKEKLGLTRAPTEKQTQAYVDNELSDLVQDIRIADANVKSWKREVDLLDNKISAEKYRVRLVMGLING